MKNVNIKNFRRLSIRSLLTILLPIYIIIGALQKIEMFHITHYILGLVIQIISVLLLAQIHIKKRYIRQYLVTILLVLCITIRFVYLEIPFVDIINRIFPLLCIYGISISFFVLNQIELKQILFRTSILFIIVSIIMLIDILLQKIIGIGIWMPIQYLGFRYSGPFGDPNFAALYLSVALLIIYFNEYIQRKLKIIFCVVIIIDILFTGSSTTFVIFPTVCIIIAFCKKAINKLLLIQFIFIGIYLGVLIIWYNNQELFLNIGYKILSYFYSTEGVPIKYRSLSMRLEVHWDALVRILQQPLGYGPRTMVSMLHLDAHNSYIAMAFEQGIAGVLLIINSLSMHVSKITKAGKACFLYLICMAFLLNVHDLTVYTILLMLIQVIRDDGVTEARICKKEMNRDEKNICNIRVYSSNAGNWSY